MQTEHIQVKSTVEALKQRAMVSPVFNDMAHVFALRERTRQQITVANLYATMLREGFKHPKQAYINELEFMASIGIGKLDYDVKERVRSLKNIKVTLQSIGLAAANKTERLAKASLPVHFTALPMLAVKPKETKPEKPYAKLVVLVEIEGKQAVLKEKTIDAIELVNLIQGSINKNFKPENF